jgi:hypothetical protein
VVAWVPTFPAGEVRQEGLRIIAKHWLTRDPKAAFTWFDRLKDPQLRTEAARALEGFILQQPDDIRDTILNSANPSILDELEGQRVQAMQDVGDNIPIRAK